MKAFGSDRFVLPLPPGHRFPMPKYRRLRERVQIELPDLIEVLEPDPASDQVLHLAHDEDYVRRVAEGGLSAKEQRTIGFPWSEQMVERSRRSVGATLAACAAALEEGVAVNLAGGTHHAMRDSGQGYCVFNDVAVAARLLQRNTRAEHGRRVAIIDLDVHQGNGTASILEGDANTFTFSIHCQANFPFRKACSDLDIGLDEGTSDAAYLAALDAGLAQLRTRFRADFVLYVSGADAHEGDRLGKLRLTTEGLRERDARVFRFADQLGVPIAVTMAGGYGHDIERTVDVHINTVRAACALWSHRRGAFKRNFS